MFGRGWLGMRGGVGWGSRGSCWFIRSRWAAWWVLSLGSGAGRGTGSERCSRGWVNHSALDCKVDCKVGEGGSGM